MGTFVVSYINFFNNDLVSTVVMSSDESEALLKGVYILQCQDLNQPVGDWENDEYFGELKGKSVEEIKSVCFDGDMAVNVLKIA